MSASEEDRNRELVRRVYESLFDGDIILFKDATCGDFEAYVTPAVPWGGVHRGAESILANVLPPLAAAIDFGSLRLVSISADGDNVAALLTALSISGEEVWLAEYWTLRDGKITNLRAFYFDGRTVVPSPAAAAS